MPQSNKFEKAKSGFKKFIEEDRKRQVVVEKTQESIEREKDTKLPRVVTVKKGKKTELPRYDSGTSQKGIPALTEQQYVTYTPQAWMQYKDRSYRESIQAHLDINRNIGMMRGWERVLWGFTEARRRMAIGQVAEIRGEVEGYRASLISQKQNIDFEGTYQYSDTGKYIPGHELYKDVSVKLGEVDKYLSGLPTDEDINKMFPHDYKTDIDTQVKLLWEQKKKIPSFDKLVSNLEQVKVMPYTVIKREVDSKTGEMGGFAFFEDLEKKADYSFKGQHPIVVGWRKFAGNFMMLPNTLKDIAVGVSVDYWSSEATGEPSTFAMRKTLKKIDTDVKLFEYDLYSSFKQKDYVMGFYKGLTSPMALTAYIGLGLNFLGWGGSKLSPVMRKGWKKLDVGKYIPKAVKKYPGKFADIRLAKQVWKQSLKTGKPDYITTGLRGSLLMGGRVEPLYYQHALSSYERFMYKPVYGTPSRYTLFQESQAVSKLKQIKFDLAHNKLIQTKTFAVMHPEKPMEGLFTTSFGERDMFSVGTIKGRKVSGVTYYKLGKTDKFYQQVAFKTKLQSKSLGEVGEYSLFESKGLSFRMPEIKAQLYGHTFTDVRTGVFRPDIDSMAGVKSYTLQKNIYAGETFLHNLKIKDIDSKRMIININNSKGRKDRIVPLSNNILLLLRKYFKQYRPKEYMFNGQKSLQYSPTSCNNIVKKYLGETYHFHLLRHSCFTNLTEQGVDLRAIQKLAGHTSSKTTEIYTQVSTQVLNNLPLAL